MCLRKDPVSPNCSDPIITNRHKSFPQSGVIETGLSGFDKMTLVVIRIFYYKQKNHSIKKIQIMAFAKKLSKMDQKLLYRVFSQIPFGAFKNILDNTFQKGGEGLVKEINSTPKSLLVEQPVNKKSLLSVSLKYVRQQTVKLFAEK